MALIIEFIKMTIQKAEGQVTWCHFGTGSKGSKQGYGT